MEKAKLYMLLAYAAFLLLFVGFGLLFKKVDWYKRFTRGYEVDEETMKLALERGKKLFKGYGNFFIIFGAVLFGGLMLFALIFM